MSESRNYSKQQLKERYDYQKSKVKWYMNDNAILKKNYKQLEGEYNRDITSLQKQIGLLEEQIAKHKEDIRLRSNKGRVVRFLSRQKTKNKRVLEKELVTFYKEVEYLSRDFDWDKSTSRLQHLEIICRTIITYNKLIAEDIISFNEFAFLLTGTQLACFKISDLEDRYGAIRGMRTDVLRAVEVGYLAKLYRKQAFYITIDGKARFNEILKHIYEERVGLYKIVKDMLIEETA